MAMNAHLIKAALATTASLALGATVVVVAITALTASRAPATASAAQTTAPLVNAPSDTSTTQVEPTIEAAQRLALAGDWAGAIDAYGQYLRTLTVEQYRDKKDFDWIRVEFERQHRPRDEAGYAPLRGIVERKLERKPVDDPDVWRLHRLLADIRRKCGDAAAEREHLDQAIASYPAQVEGDPSVHSSLQHLYNSFAMIIAEDDLNEAEQYLLDRFAEDGRFVYVFVLRWRQMYDARQQPQRYVEFVDRVLSAYDQKMDADPELREMLSDYAQRVRELRDR